MKDFAPTLAEAQARIAALRPAEYAVSRNAVDGAVTGLSPYVTHGFVTLPEVLSGVTANHPLDLRHKFVLQLAWRAYFRHRWAAIGDGILHSLHDGPLPDAAYATEMPADIRQARTGIPVIDTAVRSLYATGYLHNHARLWLASYVVHLRKLHWRAGADWLIAHLLDGDLASNHLSWQWVAGTGSHKPYVFNADNVARFAPTEWHSPGNVLDISYEALDAIARDANARCVPVSDAAGVEEPALSHRPPQARHPELELVAGRDVWLVHPWALRAPPSDAAKDSLRLGIFLTDFHDLWPWSERRWRFVSEGMAASTDACWTGDAATLRQALQTARSVRCHADPHLPWLDGLATCAPVPELFAEVDGDCRSFSQWWPRATQGMQGPLDTSAITSTHPPSEGKAHELPNPQTSRTALVTGARGGIGREVVARLRQAGHRVAAVGRDAALLAEVEADAHIAADTTTPEGAAAAVAGCADALGSPPSLLAHCVGSTLIAPLHRSTAAQYREVLRVNLDSAFFMLQAWVEALRSAQLPGAAVLASSVVSRIGVANHEAIAAAKGGIEALARSAAATYAAQGLRINVVAPGMTDTPMTAGMLRLDAMREGAGRQYPLGGVQTAAQVADTMAWLLSDGAARITGQVIAVDGGFCSVRPLVK